MPLERSKMTKPGVLCQDNINGLLVTVYNNNTADIQGHGMTLEGVILPFKMTITGKLLTITPQGKITFGGSLGDVHMVDPNFQNTDDQKPLREFSLSNNQKTLNTDVVFEITGNSNILNLSNMLDNLTVTGNNNDITIISENLTLKIPGNNNSIFIRGKAKLIQSIGHNNTFRFLKS